MNAGGLLHIARVFITCVCVYRAAFRMGHLQRVSDVISICRAYEHETWIFFVKNTFNSEERQKVCSVACCTFVPSFGQIVNTTSVKIFSFCCELFVNPLFHIFVRTKTLLIKCVTHRYKHVIIGRSWIWWVSRIESNCFQRFCRMWWRNVIKNHFVLSFSVFWLLFKLKTVQSDQLVLIIFSINLFPSLNNSSGPSNT